MGKLVLVASKNLARDIVEAFVIEIFRGKPGSIVIKWKYCRACRGWYTEKDGKVPFLVSVGIISVIRG
jgi:hypothetical protein